MSGPFNRKYIDPARQSTYIAMTTKQKGCFRGQNNRCIAGIWRMPDLCFVLIKNVCFICLASVHKNIPLQYT